MSFSAGEKLGPYEIVGQIGALIRLNVDLGPRVSLCASGISGAGVILSPDGNRPRTSRSRGFSACVWTGVQNHVTFLLNFFDELERRAGAGFKK